MEQTQISDFCINGWRVRPSLNRMERGAEVVQVEPKIMQVLLCLADNPGAVVTREALLEQVWTGTVVHNDVLSRSISELRKIFGDDPKQPQVIETIRSIGYRLIAPVDVPSQHLSSSNQYFAPRNGWRFLALALIGVAMLGWWLGPRSTAVSPVKPLPIQPITSDPGHERHPALSPDGTEVAFVWAQPNTGTPDIYRKPLAVTASPIQVTDHPGIESAPAWSPDGTHLAFVRTHDGQCTVIIHTLPTHHERSVASCRQTHSVFPSWSSDGNWLVFSDRQMPNAPFRLTLVHTQTGEQRFPLDAWTEDDVMMPAFAPHSSRIAFVKSDATGTWQLYTYDLQATAQPTVIVPNAGKTVSLAWSPDEQFLIAVMLYNGDFGLWQIQLASQQATWLPVSANDLEHVSMARHHPRLVYEVATSDENIWALPLRAPDQAAGPPERRIASTQNEAYPRFSSDGKRIAFQSQRSGNNEIWLSNSDGTDLKQLTHFQTVFTWAPAWSPDNSRLAFHAWVDLGTDLFTLDAAGNAPERLTTLPHHEREPRFAPDGTGIYFRSNQNGAWDIWYTSFTNPEPQAITQNRGIAAFMPIQGTLYYTASSDLGLYRLDLALQQETHLLNLTSSTDYRTWTVVSDGVYFIQRDSSYVPHLVFFDFGTQTTTTVYPLPYISNKSGLSRSPDGRWLLYGQMDQSESDIVLLNCALQIDTCTPYP